MSPGATSSCPVSASLSACAGGRERLPGKREPLSRTCTGSPGTWGHDSDECFLFSPLYTRRAGECLLFSRRRYHFPHRCPAQQTRVNRRRVPVRDVHVSVITLPVTVGSCAPTVCTCRAMTITDDSAVLPFQPTTRACGSVGTDAGAIWRALYALQRVEALARAHTAPASPL